MLHWLRTVHFLLVWTSMQSYSSFIFLCQSCKTMEWLVSVKYSSIIFFIMVLLDIHILEQYIFRKQGKRNILIITCCVKTWKCSPNIPDPEQTPCWFNKENSTFSPLKCAVSGSYPFSRSSSIIAEVVHKMDNFFQWIITTLWAEVTFSRYQPLKIHLLSNVWTTTTSCWTPKRAQLRCTTL